MNTKLKKQTVAQYFNDTLRQPLRKDYRLDELEVDTPCGRDCAATIVHTTVVLQAIKAAYPDMAPEVLGCFEVDLANACAAQCAVYWLG